MSVTCIALTWSTTSICEDLTPSTDSTALRMLKAKLTARGQVGDEGRKTRETWPSFTSRFWMSSIVMTSCMVSGSITRPSRSATFFFISSSPVGVLSPFFNARAGQHSPFPSVLPFSGPPQGPLSFCQTPCTSLFLPLSAY